MKYYSEVLKKIFDSEDECAKAEEAQAKKEEEAKLAAERKAKERKERAAEVETAMKEMQNAINHYREVLSKFCKDYGTYHYTFKKNELPDLSLLDLLDWF